MDQFKDGTTSTELALVNDDNQHDSHKKGGTKIAQWSNKEIAQRLADRRLKMNQEAKELTEEEIEQRKKERSEFISRREARLTHFDELETSFKPTFGAAKLKAIQHEETEHQALEDKEPILVGVPVIAPDLVLHESGMSRCAHVCIPTKKTANLYSSSHMPLPSIFDATGMYEGDPWYYKIKIGFNNSINDSNHGGFPCSVGAHNSENLPFLNGKGDVIERCFSKKRLADVAYIEDRIHEL